MDRKIKSVGRHESNIIKTNVLVFEKAIAVFPFFSEKM